MSQAELHFIRARLHGGKINKAKKGKLKFPLPVGFCYDSEGNVVPDPNEEVRSRVKLLFSLFRETGSAYSVVMRFSEEKFDFPKRSYGGVWNGKIIWGKLNHGRVLGVLKNPSYAGVYVFGRHKQIKTISSRGKIVSQIKKSPIESWQITIKEHHEGYITWEEFLKYQKTLETLLY